MIHWTIFFKSVIFVCIFLDEASSSWLVLVSHFLILWNEPDKKVMGTKYFFAQKSLGNFGIGPPTGLPRSNGLGIGLAEKLEAHKLLKLGS